MINLDNICQNAVNEIDDFQGIYIKEKLVERCKNIVRESMDMNGVRDSVMQAALELTTEQEPKWQYIASKLYMNRLYDEVKLNRGNEFEENPYKGFYEFIKEMTDKKLYGKYILENYTENEINELEKEIRPERDFIFTYSGIDLLAKRYLIQNYDRKPLELPQQMFMGIAMHLAIPEKQENRVMWAKRFYDVLSSLKATMATPTMSNARKPFYQLSSCFIDTVEDSLKGIYKSLDNFAEVSKFGGGMGIYLGKIRAIGSAIRGFKGASGDRKSVV